MWHKSCVGRSKSTMAVRDVLVTGKNLTMASVFKDRLNKLVSGYNKIADTPSDVMSMVESLLCIEDTIELKQRIYPDGYELLIDKFVANVIGTDNIAKYQGYYYEGYARSNPIEFDVQFCKLLELDNQYVAFTEYEKFGSRLQNVQFRALDEGGQILIASKWFQLYHRAREEWFQLNENQVKSYFDAKFDINNNGFINMDQWASRMQEIDEDDQFSVNGLKKVFHFILLRSNKQSQCLDRNDFVKIVQGGIIKEFMNK